MNSLFPEKYAVVITELSILVSFASFFISLYIIRETKNIKKSLKSQVRINETIKGLKKYYKECDNLLLSFEENKSQITTILYESKVLVENSISKISNNSVKSSCKEFTKNFHHKKVFVKYKIYKFDKDSVEKILIELSSLTVTLEEWQKDLQSEKNLI